MWPVASDLNSASDSRGTGSECMDIRVLHNTLEMFDELFLLQRS